MYYSKYSLIKNNFIIFSLFFLFSCSQDFLEHSISKSTNNPDSENIDQTLEESFSQFQDIPIPDGSIMIIEKTLLLGEKDNWIGRLVITNPIKPAKIFDFFKQKLTDYNWNEITSVRSSTSVLTYSLNKRIMTIQIAPIKYSNLYNSNISITMSPSINSKVK